MTSNPEPIVQQVPHDFQNLLAYVTGPNARSQTAYTVELTRAGGCWPWGRRCCGCSWSRGRPCAQRSQSPLLTGRA